MHHNISKSEQNARDCGISLPNAIKGCPKPDTNPANVALHERALTGIFEISKVLADAARLELKLAKVVDLLHSFVQMRHGIIALCDAEGGLDITVASGCGTNGNEPSRSRLPRNAIDQIVTTDTPLVADDIVMHPTFTAADIEVLGASDTVSFIGVPIRVDGNAIGALTLDRVLESRSSYRLDDDVRLLTMIANMVGQTVKLHRFSAVDRERTPELEHRLQTKFSDVKHPAPRRKKVHVEGMIGDSPAISALLEKIAVVAKAKTTVLLRGESGTGKELAAKAIHELSPRAKRPFVKLNCAALPETVLESELFGHEKGAFTSAFNSRKGRFELADKGTLFLDEIGEISASFQAKLLRVLQEQEFERVGSNQTIKVDVRVIAATNRNLEEAVARNEFRADLYYRINVVPLLVPALRQRRSDIPLLAAEFLKKFNDENGRTLTFDPRAIEVLMKCEFPGNIRELENCVHRTAILAEGLSIGRNDFACSQGQCFAEALWKCRSGKAALQPPPILSESANLATPPDAAASSAATNPLAGASHPIGARTPDIERVIAAMERCGWVQAKAARLLGLTPRQIGYVLRKYGVEIKRL
ncbi:nif-specific transcriptional activator NifA [Mesorhizobium sp. L103C131B0]|uniref:nif-specific transcriptional activator NifA n=1 Tax=Mesorhizobium sp. L103C131B0 TaxID=1287089 RepID=UPI0003CFAB97|nr:nif-specific transcriptional activator NifA [Mesorhizobium sp. L103C131B0]ESZ55987.1 ATPase AAA [Mesorhizobium sp. L103C131B0]